MKTPKRNVILLSVLLVAMTVVSMVSAAEQGLNEQNPVDVGKALNVPDHYIPPEYFMDAKPATPLPESEMITLILSGNALDGLGWSKETGIIEFPASPQALNAQFVESEGFQNLFIEKDINPDDAVVLVRMPKTMYERFLAGSENDTLTLPTSHFCRFYENLTDLNSHMELKDNVLIVTPGEYDTKVLEELTTIPPVMETPEIPGMNADANSIIPAIALEVIP